eukprot:symbB.v1.2.028520.t1/scaffold3029.1/size65043/1
MTAVLVTCLLPWIKGKKVPSETMWALVVCVDMAIILSRPVMVFDGRSMGEASKGSIAELLVVASFTFLPLRFCVALPVLLLSFCGSAVSAYMGADFMDPLLLALLGIASIYNLALWESRSRRDFRAESNVATAGVQVSSEDLRVKRSPASPIQVASSHTFQEGDFSMPLSLQPVRDPRRSHSLPNEAKDGWANVVRKIRTDGHKVPEHKTPASHGIGTAQGLEAVRRGKARSSRKIGSLDSEMAFSINVVPDADDLLGSSIFPSQSASVSTIRHQANSGGILSIDSSVFRLRQRSPNRTRRPDESPRHHETTSNISNRHSLSVSKSSDDEAAEACDSPVQVAVPATVSTVSCQTDVVWKDGGWHCTRCSKPPAPLPAGEKKPERRRSKVGNSLASVQAWKKAMSSVVHLQGNWRLVYGPENVSPWLEQFMICGTYVGT